MSYFWGMGFLEPMLPPSLFVLLAFPIVLFTTVVLSSFLQSFPSFTFVSVVPSSRTLQPTSPYWPEDLGPPQGISEWAAGATPCLCAWNAFPGGTAGRPEAPPLHA